MLGESINASTTTTHPHKTNSQHNISNRSLTISTRGESYDSLLGESTNGSNKTNNSYQHRSNSNARISTRVESNNSLLGETTNKETSSHEAIEALINENNETINLQEATNESNELSNDEAPSTRGEPSGSLLGEKGNNKTNKSKDIPFIKNVGFVNRKWTEVLVDNESESNEIDRDEIKKAIIQMTKREEHNPLDNWTDRFIRVNHKTYVPVEVAKDRNGCTMYTPLIPTEKPKISFWAEIRTPSESDSENQESTKEEIIEVEYPRIKKTSEKVQNPDVKIRLDVEIKNNRAVHNSKFNKQHQVYRSCLTKQELVNLINEEIKLEKEQSINLVEIIDKASLNEYTKVAEEDETNYWEKKAERIRS